MKKKLLLLCVIAGMALNSNAMIYTVNSATSGPVVRCWTTEPFWVGTWTCCVAIICTIREQPLINLWDCKDYNAFVSLPPNTPTRYDLPTDLSLQGAGPFSDADVQHLQEFKVSGAYTIPNDIIKVENGNTIIIKAGYYEIHNGKVGVIATATQQ